MDAIDRTLLDALQTDARTTQGELARRVGLSQPSVAERIRKLEERGLIKGYVAKADAKALGKDITAYIGVRIEHPRHFDTFDKRVGAMPEVLECHRVAGGDSYLLKILTANTQTLDSLLVEGLRTLPGVVATQTTIVLASVKESTHVQVLPARGGKTP